MLKRQNDELRSKLELMQADASNKQKEQDLKMYKLQARETELMKERENFKTQLDEAKASLEKAFNTNISNEAIGSTTSEMVKQMSNLSKQKDTL